jgi:tetratricopeptide (TPR) repeat protein
MNETYHPEELDNLGKSAFQKGKYSQAAEYFSAAAEGYRALKEDVKTAEMDNNRSVALLKGGDFLAALEAAQGTDAVFEAAGDIRRQAMALGNFAAALEGLNLIEEAIQNYEKADELFKVIGEHELRAPVLQSLSNLQFKSGRGFEGLANLNAGFEEGGKTNLRRRFLKFFTDLPIKYLTKTK